jgi:hypothetical protein
MVMDVVVKLYYEEILDNKRKSTVKLQECMERAMEQVHKDHYFAFYKHLSMCDHGLGPIFWKEIQVYYDMNLEPKMFIE